MSFRLIPRDIKFLDLFAASGENLASAAAKLRDLVNDFDRLDERIAEIQVLEKQTGRQMGTVGREIVAATLSDRLLRQRTE